MEKLRKRLSDVLHIRNELLRIFFAELLGTMVLVIIGDGSVAQVVLSRKGAGDFFTINVAFALAIAFGVYICGGVSGGHINSAVSLAMAILGKISWVKLPVYLAAQHLGAFLGAAVVFGIYYDAIFSFERFRYGFSSAVPLSTYAVDPSKAAMGLNTAVYNGTAGIFATYPAEHLTIAGGLFDQILGTALLVGLVLAICDAENMSVPKYLVPVLVGLVVGAVGMSFGFNCGFALNPPRDLGPRIFTAVAGWGADVFRAPIQGCKFGWFWVPIVGPYLGALVGAFGYLLFVGNNWPRPAVQLQPAAIQA